MEEDQVINAALADRVAIKINEAVHLGEASYENIVCPECSQSIPWMKETLLLCIRRATLEGERRLPQWCQPNGDIKYDYVCTGPEGDGLMASAPALYFHGKTNCPSCGKVLNIDIDIECRLDGQPLTGIKG